MKVKVAKWGNSLAVRLPKQIAEELDLSAGSTVELSKKGARLTLAKAEARNIPRYRLEDLLAQIKPGQKSPPFEDWGILPSEWPQDDWSDIAPSDKEWEAWKREAEIKEDGRESKAGGRRAVSSRRRA